MIARLLALLLLIAAAATAAACGSSAFGDDGGDVGTGPNAAYAALAGPGGFDPLNCDGSIGMMAPYGGFGATDTVQMNWSRVALDKFNRDHGTAYTFRPANVDFQVDRAVRLAKDLVADPNVIGVVGPKTSVVTKAVGPIFDRAGMVYVSPSATNATLTDGSLRHFYRVVASDAQQAPRMAEFIADELQPSTVLVVRDEEPYSQGFAKDLLRVLDERGVRTEVVDVKTEQEDYSAVVTRVNESVNVVAMPLLVATDATRLVEQLADAGKYPKVIGGDALFVNAFQASGAYVTTYAPDISTQPAGQEIVRLYESIFGDFESFGGPAYVATEALLTAATTACAENGSVTRGGVATAMPNVELEETLLGHPLRFDEHHEMEGATVQVYRLGPRGFELVGDDGAPVPDDGAGHSG